jgi:hypothetical protein
MSKRTMAVKTVVLTVFVALALVLMPSSALAAGGPIKLSDKRLTFPFGASSVDFFDVQNRSDSLVTLGTPVLSGDTTAFEGVIFDPDTCWTLTSLPSGSDCIYEFRFNPPSDGTFKAIASLPIDGRTFKVTLTGTSP